MTTNGHLGRLERVPPRTFWSDEARDFTPWLATEDNLALLSETIGVDLELQDQEVSVGPFRADVLCRDVATDALVLVENQLERTDHRHLGQLFTYAAGLDAVTVVWIAERFHDEHRAALDWLNRITHEDFRFFGIEVELWRIGDSALAPKFNLVAKPNDWSKTVRDAASAQRSGASSESEELRLAYWRSFKEAAQDRRSRFGSLNPVSRPRVNFGVGRTGFGIGASVRMMYHATDGGADVYLWITDDEDGAYLDQLHAEREQIEAEIGQALTWDRKPDYKATQVIAERECDPTYQSAWPTLNAWMIDTLEAFDQAFRPRLKRLEEPADLGLTNDDA